MRKTVFVMLAMALVPFGASAVDGVVLINQSTVMAQGGFPYTISVSGSYKLSGNLDVRNTQDPANTTAIWVTADNVTIDLNGFSIIGPTVCVGSPVTSCSPTSSPGKFGGYGVYGGNNSNITVFNGTVRGMGTVGISLAFGAYVEKVHVESNAFTGIQFVASATAIGNRVIGNGVNGINAVGGSLLSGNRSVENGGVGISVECPSVVVGNIAFHNNFNFRTLGPNNCQLAYIAP
jgi:hypothetical protein